MNYELLETKQGVHLGNHIFLRANAGALFRAVIKGTTDIAVYNNPVYNHLRTVFSKNSKAWLYQKAIGAYYNEAMSLWEYARLLYGSKSEVERMVSKFTIVYNRFTERVENSSESIVFFTAHFCCPFLPLFNKQFYRLLNGRRVSCVAPVQEQNRKIRMQERIREITGLDFSFVDVNDSKSGIKLIRTIKEKGVVICAMDYAYNHTRNETQKFLNSWVNMPVGILIMLQRFKVDCFMCYSLRVRRTIKCEITKQIIQEPGSNALLQMASEVNSEIERWVLQNPEQWTMWRRLGK